MKHVYEVEFELRYSGIREWMPESVHVLGNGDASKVVEQVRRHEFKGSFEDVTKAGEVVTRRVVDFRMTGVTQVMKVDY
jgi:hypothetical protein